MIVDGQMCEVGSVCAGELHMEALAHMQGLGQNIASAISTLLSRQHECKPDTASFQISPERCCKLPGSPCSVSWLFLTFWAE